MAFWINLILILILLGAALSGYRQGFIALVGRLVGFAAGILAGLLYTTGLVAYLEQTLRLTTWLQKFLAWGLQLGTGASGPRAEILFSGTFFGEYLRQLIQRNSELLNPDRWQNTWSLAEALVNVGAFLLLVFGTAALVGMVWGLTLSWVTRAASGGCNRLVGLVVGLGLQAAELALSFGLLVPLLRLAAGCCADPGGFWTRLAIAADQSVVLVWLTSQFTRAVQGGLF